MGTTTTSPTVGPIVGPIATPTVGPTVGPIATPTVVYLQNLYEKDITQPTTDGCVLQYPSIGLNNVTCPEVKTGDVFQPAGCEPVKVCGTA